LRTFSSASARSEMMDRLICTFLAHPVRRIAGSKGTRPSLVLAGIYSWTVGRSIGGRIPGLAAAPAESWRCGGETGQARVSGRDQAVIGEWQARNGRAGAYRL